MGKTARETYIQTIIRRELMLNALQINQKIMPYRLFHRAIDETLKSPGKCWPFLCLNLPEYTLLQNKRGRWLIAFKVSNCKGKQNQRYFQYPLSTRNIDHENKLH